MSMTRENRETLYGPAGRWPVFAAIGVVVASLVLVFIGVTTDTGTVREDRGTVLQSRDLEIREMPNGALAILDAASGAELEIYDKDRGGFIRAAKRGIDQLRKVEAVPAETPFRLSSWSGGSVTLTDTGTDKTIVISSFGLQNTRAFTALLTPTSREDR